MDAMPCASSELSFIQGSPAVPVQTNNAPTPATSDRSATPPSGASTVGSCGASSSRGSAPQTPTLTPSRSSATPPPSVKKARNTDVLTISVTRFARRKRMKIPMKWTVGRMREEIETHGNLVPGLFDMLIAGQVMRDDAMLVSSLGIGNGTVVAMEANGTFVREDAMSLHGMRASMEVFFEECRNPTTPDLALLRTALASHIDVNATDEEGDTPLHMASRAGNLEVVQLLISHGAVVAKHGGLTPAEVATCNDRPEIVKYFQDLRAAGGGGMPAKCAASPVCA